MRMQHITMVAYRRFKLLRHCFLGSNTREVVTSSKQNYFYNSCELFIYLFAHNFQNLNVFEIYLNNFQCLTKLNLFLLCQLHLKQKKLSKNILLFHESSREYEKRKVKKLSKSFFFFIS